MIVPPCRDALDAMKPCEFAETCHAERQRQAQAYDRRGMDCTWYVMIVQKIAYDPPEDDAHAAKIPTGCRVVLRTHNDDAGERYAQQGLSI